MSDGVRCQNPKCKKKLAGWLNGELKIKCANCGLEQTIIIRMRDTSLAGKAQASSGAR